MGEDNGDRRVDLRIKSRADAALTEPVLSCQGAITSSVCLSGQLHVCMRVRRCVCDGGGALFLFKKFLFNLKKTPNVLQTPPALQPQSPPCTRRARGVSCLHVTSANFQTSANEQHWRGGGLGGGVRKVRKKVAEVQECGQKSELRRCRRDAVKAAHSQPGLPVQRHNSGIFSGPGGEGGSPRRLVTRGRGSFTLEFLSCKYFDKAGWGFSPSCTSRCGVSSEWQVTPRDALAHEGGGARGSREQQAKLSYLWVTPPILASSDLRLTRLQLFLRLRPNHGG